MTFKNFLLTEAFNNFEYKIPENKKHLLFDFYILISLPIENIKEKRGGHEASIIANEAKNKIINYLQPQLLEEVLFSVCAEFRHIIDNNDSSDILDLAQKNNMKDFIKKYISYYSIKKSNLGEKFLTDKRIRSDISGNTERTGSYKAYKYSKVNNLEFIKFAQKCFTDLKWRDSYGGDAWAAICSGWIRLYDANDINSKIIAIDHVFDLQHNTDTVFNKILDYNIDGDYSWINVALTKKRNAIDLYDMWNDMSPQLQLFSAYIIKLGTGKDYESYLRKKQIKIEQNILNYSNNRDSSYDDSNDNDNDNKREIKQPTDLDLKLKEEISKSDPIISNIIKLIRQGADVNIHDGELINTCAYNDLDKIFKILLDNGYKLDAKINKNIGSAISQCFYNNSYKMLYLLLKNDIFKNYSENDIFHLKRKIIENILRNVDDYSNYTDYKRLFEQILYYIFNNYKNYELDLQSVIIKTLYYEKNLALNVFSKIYKNLDISKNKLISDSIDNNIRILIDSGNIDVLNSLINAGYKLTNPGDLYHSKTEEMTELIRQQLIKNNVKLLFSDELYYNCIKDNTEEAIKLINSQQTYKKNIEAFYKIINIVIDNRNTKILEAILNKTNEAFISYIIPRVVSENLDKAVDQIISLISKNKELDPYILNSLIYTSILKNNVSYIEKIHKKFGMESLLSSIDDHLKTAIYNNCKDVVLFFINNNVDFNMKDGEILRYIINLGRLEILEILLSNSKIKINKQLLDNAVEFESSGISNTTYTMSKSLIEKYEEKMDDDNYNIDHLSKKLINKIKYYNYDNSDELLKYLKKGADIFFNNNIDAMNILINRNLDIAIKYIIDNNPKIKDYINEILKILSSKKNNELIKYILKKIKITDNKLLNELAVLGAIDNNEEIIDILKTNGVDLSPKRDTLLKWAGINDNIKLLEKLLENGIQLNEVDDIILISAIQNKNTKMIKYLIENKKLKLSNEYLNSDKIDDKMKEFLNKII